MRNIIPVPIILIGTGGTIPLGIPGMWELSKHLIHQLNDKYKEDTTWISIVDKLQSGIDNDDQIQERIIAEIRTGKPIVVVTKSITDRAMHLLLSNSNNFIVIEEDPDKPNATRFTIENANMVTCLRTVLYQ